MRISRFQEIEGKLCIRDIKNYLVNAQMSPERFAAKVQLSHMTIRRWLKRQDNHPIPEKYHSLLTPVLMGGKVTSATPPHVFSIRGLMGEIERSGKQFKNIEKLDSDLRKKLKSAGVEQIFFRYGKRLLAAIKSPHTSLKSKAIATGALIYFISPIDLIPDHIPVVGYLDDLAVLSLAVESLAKDANDGVESAPKTRIPGG